MSYWAHSSNDFKLIGHRGCRGRYQENSLQAIRWAYQANASAVEVDVWHIDQELVLIHDRRASQYLPNDDLITETSLLDLRAVMDVPSLNQALMIVPKKLGFNIEIKDSGIELACIKAVNKLIDLGYITWDQLLFSCFDHRVLKTLKGYEPRANIGLLFSGIINDIAQYSTSMQACSVNLDLGCIDRTTVKSLLAKDLAVYVYTVNNPKDAKLMREWGVSGIFCDDVAAMQQALR
jgi:glycerophosphoryl diester phosphodiesterase